MEISFQINRVERVYLTRDRTHKKGSALKLFPEFPKVIVY